MQCVKFMSPRSVVHSTIALTLATLGSGCWLVLTDELEPPNGPTGQPSSGSGGAGGGAGGSGGSGGLNPAGVGGGEPVQCTTLSEVEPNNQSAPNNQPLLGDGTTIKGSFASSDDADQYTLMVVEDGSLVTIETFDQQGHCSNLATSLVLTDESLDKPLPWDQSWHNGIKNCSAITGRLKAGRYIILTEQGASNQNETYLLQVRRHRTEFAQQSDGPTNLPNTNEDIFVTGKLGVGKYNKYNITLSARQSVHATLIHPESCSNYKDVLELQFPENKGSQKRSASWGGRCAVVDAAEGVDGAQISASSPGAGTYTLNVQNNGEEGFDYTLVVTVRENDWCGASPSSP